MAGQNRPTPVTYYYLSPTSRSCLSREGSQTGNNISWYLGQELQSIIPRKLQTSSTDYFKYAANHPTPALLRSMQTQTLLAWVWFWERWGKGIWMAWPQCHLHMLDQFAWVAAAPISILETKHPFEQMSQVFFIYCITNYKTLFCTINTPISDGNKMLFQLMIWLVKTALYLKILMPKFVNLK